MPPKRTLALVLALTALTYLTGCINISSMQTARTTPKGDIEVIVGGGVYTIVADVDVNDDDESDGDFYIPAPGVEMRARYGITDELDAGLRLTVIGTAGLDVKYQALDMGDFALAFGGELGYISLSTGVGDAEAGFSFFDVTVPVYASFHPEAWIALYVVPKYVLRVSSGNAGSNGAEASRSAVSHFGGGSAGIKLGSTWGVIAEGSYALELEYRQIAFTQVNGAFFVQF